MLAYLVLLFAVLSRLVPVFFHATSLSYGAWNFTAVGGGLLFFGSRMASSPNEPPARTGLKLASAVAALMATDYCLTVFAYHYPFHLRGYIVTWVWYAAVCLLGMEILRRATAFRVIAGVLASATSFFLLSNFTVWAGGNGHLYPHSLAGLGACYVAAIPFYRNDLISTALTAGVLFGLPALAARITEALHAAQNDNLPLA
jgi:hypothetical protein